MPDIHITNELTVGLTSIDEQHKQIVDLSNGLIQAMVNGMGKDVLDEVILELKEYTDSHFEDEEKYMAEIGYPHLEEQKAAHKKLIEEVDEMRARLNSAAAVSPTEVLNFINGWIIKHIKENDLKIGDFVKSK